MKLLAKSLIGAEIVLCFGPVVALWILGVYLLPTHIHALFTQASLKSIVLIGWITAGGFGLIALIAVLKELFMKTEKKLSPKVVKPGLVVGFLAVLPLVHPAFPNPWNLLAILPLFATIHIAYLARGYLFGKNA